MGVITQKHNFLRYDFILAYARHIFTDIRMTYIVEYRHTMAINTALQEVILIS